MHTDTLLHACANIGAYMYIYIYMFIHSFMCSHMHICNTYVYIYIHVYVLCGTGHLANTSAETSHLDMSFFATSGELVVLCLASGGIEKDGKHADVQKPRAHKGPSALIQGCIYTSTHIYIFIYVNIFTYTQRHSSDSLHKRLTSLVSGHLDPHGDLWTEAQFTPAQQARGGSA